MKILIYFLMTLSLYSQQKQNVLFIVIDDLKTSLSHWGDKTAITPHIDQLSEQGLAFTNAHCQIAICNPSRASVMTGMRPDSIKVWGLSKHFRKEKPEVITLPQAFKNAGYQTISIGKIYHGTGAASKDPQSWTEKPIFDSVSKSDAYMLPKNKTGKKAAATELAEVKDEAHIDGQVAKKAIEKLKELKKSDKPFFLAVGFRKPHLPFAAPKKYWVLYKRSSLNFKESMNFPKKAPTIATHKWPELRGYTDIPNKGKLSPQKEAELRHGYYAAVSYIDAQIGKVIEELKKQKLYNSTTILLYSDHGFHLGEQDFWGKLTNYDAATKVPLIIASPKLKGKGHSVQKPVELIDIYPTLLEVCGIKKPEHLEGKSLLIHTTNGIPPEKTFAISQFPRPVSYNFINKNPVNMGYSIRSQNHRYTAWINFKTKELISEELYSYKKSMTEQVNEVDNPSFRQIKQELKSKLFNYIKENK